MPKKKVYREAVKEALQHDIPEGWIIHHINGDHEDNRISNLFLVKRAVHWKLHLTKSSQYLHPNLDLIKAALDDGVDLGIKKRKRRKNE